MLASEGNYYWESITMESKDQIKKRLKEKYDVELTPNSDFSKFPDIILANAHLYDWGDKVSIQANVEMSRRLKEVIYQFEETMVSIDRENAKLQRRIFTLSVIAIILAITQIVPMIDTIIKWLK